MAGAVPSEAGGLAPIVNGRTSRMSAKGGSLCCCCANGDRQLPAAPASEGGPRESLACWLLLVCWDMSSAQQTTTHLSLQADLSAQKHTRYAEWQFVRSTKDPT